MRTDRENKLKCLKSEVVQMETLQQACMCCELLDKMGERWCNDKSYIEGVSWSYQKKTCYNINKRECTSADCYVIKENKTIITATEWLNRHGVFVPGQDVYAINASVERAKEQSPVSFVHGQVVVDYNQMGAYQRGGKFDTITRNYIVSPYPEWKEEPKQVRFCLGDNETMISAESAKAIGELVLVLKNTATLFNCTS